MRRFLDGVAVPGGDADDDGALFLHNRLATQAAIVLQPRRFFNAILFVLLGLGAEVATLFEIDMTR